MADAVPKLGDVWLVPFPMPSHPEELKKRPGVVVSSVAPGRAGDTAVIAAISSKLEYMTRFSIRVDAHTRLASAMGLRRDAAIFCDILHTFGIDELLRMIGHVNQKTLSRIQQNITQVLGLDG